MWPQAKMIYLISSRLYNKPSSVGFDSKYSDKATPPLVHIRIDRHNYEKIAIFSGCKYRFDMDAIEILLKAYSQAYQVYN